MKAYTYNIHPLSYYYYYRTIRPIWSLSNYHLSNLIVAWSLFALFASHKWSSCATTENIVTTKPSNRDNAIMMVKDRKCGTLYQHERWYLSVSVGYYIFFLMAITIIPSRVYFWYASTLFIARKDKRRRRHRRRCVNKELRTIYKQKEKKERSGGAWIKYGLSFICRAWLVPHTHSVWFD